MSTEVFIGHMNPGYNKHLEVNLTDNEGVVRQTAIIPDGQCRRFIVYNNQNIQIKEVDGRSPS